MAVTFEQVLDLLANPFPLSVRDAASNGLTLDTLADLLDLKEDAPAVTDNLTLRDADVCRVLRANRPSSHP
jgi:hypothetical protein